MKTHNAIIWAAVSVAVIIIGLTCTASSSSADEPEHVTLFKSGDHGSKYYRIPALVTTGKGTLIAVADRRNDSQADLPNMIDVVARRSTDNGRTWSDQIVIASHTDTAGYGDAALVCDRNTGDILCIFASGCGMWNSTAENPIDIFLSRSSDDGLTWSAPRCITQMLYGPDCGNPASQHISGMFAASGRALQLEDGTLAFSVAAHHTGEKWPPLHNYICISEDDGQTWNLLPTPASDCGDESKLVELYDGRWLLSIRNPDQGHRRYAISGDRGKSWSETAEWSDLDDPACNGDIMRYTLVKKDRIHRTWAAIRQDISRYTLVKNSRKRNCLVHSLPCDPKARRNVTIALSFDNGRTWPVRRCVWNCDAGYSALTSLQDGTIGLLTEVGNWDTGFELIFTRISPEWLLGRTTKN